MKSLYESLKEKKELNESFENIVITESQDVSTILKNNKVKILLLLDDDGKLVDQIFVDSEGEARKIAKSRMKEWRDAQFIDLGADKTQKWHTPKKD